MTPDQAQEKFFATITRPPSKAGNNAAAAYLRTLMNFEAAGLIGDDRWLDGLTEIAIYLAE